MWTFGLVMIFTYMQVPTLLGIGRMTVKLELPRDPEGLPDPKQSLRAVLSNIGMKGPEDVYSYFGNNVDLDTLRRLPAFRRFEDELSTAVRELGHRQ